MSIHVYWLHEWMRCSTTLACVPVEGRPNSETLTTILLTQLVSKLQLQSTHDLRNRVVMGASDGATVLQGNKDGVLLKVRDQCAPFALSMHCMAHRVDLCAETIETHMLASYVFKLVNDVSKVFAWGGRRNEMLHEFQQKLGLKSQNLPPHCDTRWISHIGPLECFIKHLFPIFLAISAIASGKTHESDGSGQKASAKTIAPAKIALDSLCDYTVLLTAAAMLPMFRQLQSLILLLQKDQLYICDAADGVQETLSNIQSMYTDIIGSFSGATFRDFLVLSTPSANECPLIEGEDGTVMLKIDWNEGSPVPQPFCETFELSARKGGRGRPGRFQMTDIPVVVQYVKDAVRAIATTLTTDISSRFPQPKLMRSLGIVFPQTFENLGIKSGLPCEQFDSLVTVFIDHFGVKRGGVDPMINGQKLRDEQARFVSDAAGSGCVGVAEVSRGGDPDVPRVVKFWRALGSDSMARSLYPEWFKAAEIVLVMVSGSVADERTFWSMNFIKTKLRNRLDKHLEACVLLHQPRNGFHLFDQHTFPYKKAVAKRFPNLCVKTQVE